MSTKRICGWGNHKTVIVAGEAGDASPSTPIGVTYRMLTGLETQTSKSVSLGNIIHAYEMQVLC